MLTNLIAYHFDKAADLVLPALLVPIGFTVKRRMERAVIMETDRVQLTIACGYTATVMISVRPLWDGFESRRPWYDPLDSHNVLEAFAPELDESDSYPRAVRRGEDIQLEMDRQLQNLITYCKPLLKGDAMAWSALDNWAVSWGGLWQRDDENKTDYVQRLREAASDSWQARRYWKLQRIYGRLGNLTILTLRDRYRLHIARRHTYMIG